VGDEVLDERGACIRTLLALLTANGGGPCDDGNAVVSRCGVLTRSRTHTGPRNSVSRLRWSLSPAAVALAVDELIVTHPTSRIFQHFMRARGQPGTRTVIDHVRC
jgi:hypothetical protein